MPPADPSEGHPIFVSAPPERAKAPLSITPLRFLKHNNVHFKFPNKIFNGRVFLWATQPFYILGKDLHLASNAPKKPNQQTNQFVAAGLPSPIG